MFYFFTFLVKIKKNSEKGFLNFLFHFWKTFFFLTVKINWPDLDAHLFVDYKCTHIRMMLFPFVRLSLELQKFSVSMHLLH